MIALLHVEPINVCDGVTPVFMPDFGSAVQNLHKIIWHSSSSSARRPLLYTTWATAQSNGSGSVIGVLVA